MHKARGLGTYTGIILLCMLDTYSEDIKSLYAPIQCVRIQSGVFKWHSTLPPITCSQEGLAGTK